jgi:hypothetical protein
MLYSEDNPNISYSLGYKYKYPLNLVGNYKNQLVRSMIGSSNTFAVNP